MAIIAFCMALPYIKVQWRNLPVAKTDKLDPPQAPAIAPKAGAHPGPLIRDKLKAAGFSIPGAAVAIGMNRANLNMDL